MKLLMKITSLVAIAAVAAVVTVTPVKADSIPTQVVFLMKQMEIQKAENAKAQEYFKLQEARSKAEKRKISDIEMVKRQALEGMVQGNNNLLQMGDAAIALGQPDGEYNIAFLDQQAYEGFVAGMAELERVKRDTWMQYTFRTH